MKIQIALVVAAMAIGADVADRKIPELLLTSFREMRSERPRVNRLDLSDC